MWVGISGDFGGKKKENSGATKAVWMDTVSHILFAVLIFMNSDCGSSDSLHPQHKTRTYILGEKLSNLDKLLNDKKFIGTTIEG